LPKRLLCRNIRGKLDVASLQNIYLGALVAQPWLKLTVFRDERRPRNFS